MTAVMVNGPPGFFFGRVPGREDEHRTLGVIMKGALVPVHAYTTLPTRADIHLPSRTDTGREGREALKRVGNSRWISSGRVHEVHQWEQGSKITGRLIDVYA